MLDTSARLLRLLALLQTRRDWPGAELASRLGVTTRTVRNDMARLRELGYPVEASPGVAGGYRLAPGGVLPPLLLDDDEAGAVAAGLRTAAGRGGASVEEGARPAIHRCEARVTVQAPASVVVGRVPPDVLIEPIDEGSCVVHAYGSTPEVLALHLGWLDADFTVHDGPPELVACLGRLAARFGAAVSELPSRRTAAGRSRPPS